MTYNGQSVYNRTGKTEIKYSISDVSNGNDGTYKCHFVLDDEEQFSETIYLIARKATMLLLLDSSPVTQIVSGFKLTLECDIAGGAKSFKWFQNGEELTVYETVSVTKVESNELTEKMKISLITNNDSDNPVDDQFKCQGIISDETVNFPETIFNSSSTSLRVFPAKTTKAPADNEHAYEDESHELVCQFPDSNVVTKYTVSWEFNKKIIVDQTGWYTVDTERSIVDEIAFIETILKITKVDPGVDGKYSCSITWENGVVINSGETTLTVRTITEPPEAFSMSSGAPVTLTCSVEGDKVAAISFSVTDKDMSRDITVEVTETQDDQQRVTTVGKLTPNLTVSSYIYCAAQWDDDATILKSTPISATVLAVNIQSPDAPDGWGAENGTLKIECSADVLLPSLEKVDVDFEWMLRLEKSSQWVKVEGNKDIEFEIEEPKIGGDKKLISTLTLGPIQIQHSAYDIKCSVDYHSDTEEAFHGGKVSSDEFELKVRHIKSFWVDSDDTIVEGGSFDLVCSAYGPPESVVTFELINNNNELDSSRYTITDESSSISEKQNYLHHYTVTTSEAVLNGDYFFCTVQFTGSSVTMSKQLRVKTYYDCTKAPISSIEKISGMSIKFTDDKGDRTAKVICPDDNDNMRYIVDVTDDAKEESFCSKSTGSYEPPQLATCKTIYPFVDGKYEQVWDLQKADFTVCEYENTSENYYYSSTKIRNILAKKSDTCGTYIAVPCLKTNECTLVENRRKTDCGWNEDTKALTIYYAVKLTNKVWTVKERDALVNLPLKSKLRFWDCDKDEPSSSEGKYFDQMEYDADSNTLIHNDIPERKSYTGLYVGIVVAILMAIGAAIVIYYRKKLRRRISVNSQNSVSGSIGDNVDLNYNVLSKADVTSSTAQIIT
ncbi:uncharacterized protein LOC134817185 isoform X2 [Bolinopsis microptera]|uniref:uncharacterized protein LOC134817185 isoform X2 n=1 Tax=Bolinopsis microptera TaxID=2820187 RepID=UPI003078D125